SYGGFQRGRGTGHVFGRVDHPHGHLRAAGAGVRAIQRLVALRRHPGEVVHVALHVVVRGTAVRRLRLTLQLAHRAHGVVAGHVQVHVVAAEVGVELAV